MADEPSPRRGLPILGDTTVLPIRLVTLCAAFALCIGATVYMTTLRAEVRSIADSQNEMRNDFRDLCNALGIQRFGHIAQPAPTHP